MTQSNVGKERGAKIRVAVLSNEKKRLFLDFTNDVKSEAKKDEFQNVKEDKISAVDTESTAGTSEISEDDAASWAAYAEDYEEDYVEDEDSYEDEDRDIEDALGIGFY